MESSKNLKDLSYFLISDTYSCILIPWDATTGRIPHLHHVLFQVLWMTAVWITKYFSWDYRISSYASKTVAPDEINSMNFLIKNLLNTHIGPGNKSLHIHENYLKHFRGKQTHYQLHWLSMRVTVVPNSKVDSDSTLKWNVFFQKKP
jgi:hypothetical protein